MATRTLRLATRGSPLAVAQASLVARDVERATAGVRVELITITTTGDRIQDRPLHESGGKGLFTKEVELALLRGDADFAVHSFKDVPVTMPLVPAADHELTIAAVPKRGPVSDMLVVRDGGTRRTLPHGATVGTTSLRRRELLLDARPDLQIESLRGNVDTRLAALERGDFDAIVLAAAGLERLGRSPAHASELDPRDFVPAAGQGALAVQCRMGDADVRALLAALDDEPTRRCVACERHVVELLEGDCTSPIGAWAKPTAGGCELRVAYHDGTTLLRAGPVVGVGSPDPAATAVAMLQRPSAAPGLNRAGGGEVD